MKDLILQEIALLPIEGDRVAVQLEFLTPANETLPMVLPFENESAVRAFLGETFPTSPVFCQQHPAIGKKYSLRIEAQ